MSTRERVMTQEQLMKVKIKYLEDRLNTLERSLASVIEHQFSNLNKEQGFKDIDTKSKDNGNELI